MFGSEEKANEQFRKAEAKGGDAVFKLFQEKLKFANRLGQEQAKTLEGTISNLSEAYDQFSKEAAAPLFAGAKKSLYEFGLAILDTNKELKDGETIVDAFSPAIQKIIKFLQPIYDILAKKFDQVLKFVLNAIEFIANLLDENKAAIYEIVEIVFSVFDPQDLGRISYKEFLIALKGEISAFRLELIN